jgi:hypothetical protein
VLSVSYVLDLSRDLLGVRSMHSSITPLCFCFCFILFYIVELLEYTDSRSKIRNKNQLSSGIVSVDWGETGWRH